MGQRANFVIRQGGKDHVYYDHRCANRIENDLFWGPEDAIPFASQCDRAEDLLDDIWREGAAVIDLDKRHLLFFGGESYLYEVDYRRVHLNLMARHWHGWTIATAFEGIADIADFVGRPRSDYLVRKFHGHFSINTAFPQDNTVVLSERKSSGQLEIRRVEGEADSLSSGKKGLFFAQCADPFEELDWSGYPPTGGVHVNHLTKHLYFWWACDTPDIVRRTKDAWPGWKMTWLQDRYEDHIALCDGAWRISGRDEQDLMYDVLGALRRYLEKDREYPLTEVAGNRVYVKPNQEPEFGYGFDPTSLETKRAQLERLVADADL